MSCQDRPRSPDQTADPQADERTPAESTVTAARRWRWSRSRRDELLRILVAAVCAGVSDCSFAVSECSQQVGPVVAVLGQHPRGIDSCGADLAWCVEQLLDKLRCCFEHGGQQVQFV